MNDIDKNAFIDELIEEISHDKEKLSYNATLNIDDHDCEYGCVFRVIEILESKKTKI